MPQFQAGVPRCLDLTRLVSRAGRAAWTGIDRVEAAYLEALCARPDPLWSLVRLPRWYLLLDRAGTEALAKALFKGAPAARLSDLALRRCLRPFLRPMLRRHLPPGIRYLNIGHTNLTPRVLTAFRSLPKAQISVLLHDMIPLDYPQFQRPGTPERFEAAMRCVSAQADLVICNSDVTQMDALRYFSDWGRMPDALTARLGVPKPEPRAEQVPDGLPIDQPYFVALSTVEPRKNHALLLDVWDRLIAEMPHPPALLILGARGWNNDALFARLDAHPAKNTLIFERGGLPDGAVAHLVQGARALLFPSIAEGFGLPPLEAAQLGTAVVCSDLPITRELLGSYPVYLNVNDSYSWANVVREMATNDKVKAKTGTSEQAQLRIPTWEEHFETVLTRT